MWARQELPCLDAPVGSFWSHRAPAEPARPAVFFHPLHDCSYRWGSSPIIYSVATWARALCSSAASATLRCGWSRSRRRRVSWRASHTPRGRQLLSRQDRHRRRRRRRRPLRRRLTMEAALPAAALPAAAVVGSSESAAAMWFKGCRTWSRTRSCA